MENYRNGGNFGKQVFYFRKTLYQMLIYYRILLATVDMAICDLNEIGIAISVDTIKQLIATNQEWKDKLKKEAFSDTMLNKAINELKVLL
ncbi:MAG: hypothetical protein LBR47_06985 [Spirochaetaceae bacterium]|nr:hypothetical protein [Spirochaetaceae bacterium]